MKNETLTTDEYDALEHIERGAKHDRVNACVGRNAKRLAGLKLIDYSRDGKLALSDKGRQALFLRRCIAALRALAANAHAELGAEVARFLAMKSHIQALPEGGYGVTDKGRESLADIESKQGKKAG